MEMIANKTKGGIYEVTASPIVDLSKEIDDRQTLVRRPRFLGLGHRPTIYVPNDGAPEVKMSKLGLFLGGLTATLGFGSAAGCAGTKSHTRSHISAPEDPLADGVRNHNKNEGKDSEEYQKGVKERKSQTSKDINDNLNIQEREAIESDNKATEEGIKQAYENANRALKNRKGLYRLFGSDQEEPESGLTVPSRKLVIPDNLEIYALQRRPDKGSEKSKVSGLGGKLSAPIGKGFDAYINLERDEKDKKVVTPSGNLSLSSDGNTYGAGVGFDIIGENGLIKSDLFRLNANAGIFYRDELNKIRGVNGIKVIDEDDKIGYFGARTGVTGTLNLSDNTGIFVKAGYTSDNISGRLKGAHTSPNTKAAYDFGLGFVVRFGKGK